MKEEQKFVTVDMFMWYADRLYVYGRAVQDLERKLREVSDEYAAVDEEVRGMKEILDDLKSALDYDGHPGNMKHIIEEMKGKVKAYDYIYRKNSKPIFCAADIDDEDEDDQSNQQY